METVPPKTETEEFQLPKYDLNTTGQAEQGRDVTVEFAGRVKDLAVSRLETYGTPETFYTTTSRPGMVRTEMRFVGLGNRPEEPQLELRSFTDKTTKQLREIEFVVPGQDQGKYALKWLPKGAVYHIKPLTNGEMYLTKTELTQPQRPEVAKPKSLTAGVLAIAGLHRAHPKSAQPRAPKQPEAQSVSHEEAVKLHRLLERSVPWQEYAGQLN